MDSKLYTEGIGKKSPGDEAVLKKNSYLCTCKRKDAGVIDRGGLEIRCTACPYRGFESLSFRKDAKAKVSTMLKSWFFLFGDYPQRAGTPVEAAEVSMNARRFDVRIRAAMANFAAEN